MNILLLIGVWIVAYVAMQLISAIVGRRSNSFLSLLFATGATLITTVFL